MLVTTGTGVRLFVEVWEQGSRQERPSGACTDTLLLVHGGPGSDHTVFLPGNIPGLSRGRTVVMFDQRGNGRSSRDIQTRWLLDVWANDIVALCDRLGVESPVVWGASFGGFVVQRYLQLFPGHAKRAVLACTGSRLDPAAIAARFAGLAGVAAGAAAHKMFLGDALSEEEQTVWQESCVPLYGRRIDAVEAFGRPIRNDVLRRHFFGGEARDMHLDDAVSGAQCSVLVVGGQQDPVFDPASCRHLSGPPNNGSGLVLVGGSHLEAATAWDDPQVQRFLTTGALPLGTVNDDRSA